MQLHLNMSCCARVELAVLSPELRLAGEHWQSLRQKLVRQAGRLTPTLAEC